MCATAVFTAQETVTQRTERVSETVNQFGASCLYRLSRHNSYTLDVNTGLFPHRQHVPPTEVIAQPPSFDNIMKFIDLVLTTGFLKQNGSRFTMMNDEEAKCAAIVFSGFCIGSLVS
jgi:hypothetical protein